MEPPNVVSYFVARVPVSSLAVGLLQSSVCANGWKAGALRTVFWNSAETKPVRMI